MAEVQQAGGAGGEARGGGRGHGDAATNTPARPRRRTPCRSRPGRSCRPELGGGPTRCRKPTARRRLPDSACGWPRPCWTGAVRRSLTSPARTCSAERAGRHETGAISCESACSSLATSMHSSRMWDLRQKRGREMHGFPEREELRALASAVEERALTMLVTGPDVPSPVRERHQSFQQPARPTLRNARSPLAHEQQQAAASHRGEEARITVFAPARPRAFGIRGYA